MKIMVVHPGTQHSTKLTAAIKSCGNQVTLVTTVYRKKGSITDLFFRFFPSSEKKRINARRNSNLDDKDIVLSHELLGLILLAIARFDKKKKVYTVVKRVVAKAVGKHAAAMAVNDSYDIVISFDSYSMYIFEKLKNMNYGGRKVIDYSAAFAPYVKQVYLDIIEQYPELRSSFEAERPVLWNKNYYSDLCKEPLFCDQIICASNYTKHTLTENGVDSSKISVIPYGYDPVIDEHDCNKQYDGFTILFVGNVSIMKGIPLLIQAVREIPDSSVRLVLVGSIQDAIRKMAEKDHRIIIKGHVPHNDIGKEYCQADLFVFPSLSDGFGFAPLEAMSYGVPCAVTESAGISDIIEDGRDGFIIKHNSVNDIKNIIEFCLTNREKINQMSALAKIKATQYTSENYNNAIRQLVESIAE